MQGDLPSRVRSNHLSMQETWSPDSSPAPQAFPEHLLEARPGDAEVSVRPREVATDTEETPKGMADADHAQGCLAFHVFRPTRLR